MNQTNFAMWRAIGFAFWPGAALASAASVIDGAGWLWLVFVLYVLFLAPTIFLFAFVFMGISNWRMIGPGSPATACDSACPD